MAMHTTNLRLGAAARTRRIPRQQTSPSLSMRDRILARLNATDERQRLHFSGAFIIGIAGISTVIHLL